MPVYDYKTRLQIPEISNCVGFWKFDETAGSYDGTADECKDSSGQGNDGTAVADANTVAGGKVNNALTCDGTGDYINVADSTDFFFDTNEFGIATWVYFDSGTIHAICGQTIDDNNRWQFAYNTDSWDLYCSSGGTTRSVAWNWTIATGSWLHVAVMRTASNTYRLYINGIKIAQTSNTGARTSWPNIATDLKLGAGVRTASTDRYLTGDLDEFIIWNGASLVHTEVSKLVVGHSKPSYWGNNNINV